MSIAGGALSAGGSIVSGLLGSSASSAASKAQAAAAQEALAQQAAQQGYANAISLPYIQNGDNAQTIQNQLIGGYGASVTPLLNQLTTLGNSSTAQAALEQTPGYQFTLAQGLKSTQNAAAARGLGVSGAALKGAATYSTGLANNTYQQQYSDASNNLTQAQNTFSGLSNALAGQATLGQNAAVGQGTQGANYAAQASGLITGAGNATASGIVGSSNALGTAATGVSNAFNSYQQNQLLQGLVGNNGSQYTQQSNGLFNGGGFLGNVGSAASNPEITV